MASWAGAIPGQQAFQILQEAGRPAARARRSQACRSRACCSLRYHNFPRYAEGRVVINSVHLLTNTDRDIIGLTLLQSSKNTGSVISPFHDFRFCADHVFMLT